MKPLRGCLRSLRSPFVVSLSNHEPPFDKHLYKHALSLIALAAALLAGAVSHAAPSPDLSGPIRPVSATTEINFPHELVIKLQVEADEEIREITFFYRLGRQKTTIYGYPTFTPGTRVETEFRIGTGGGDFLPTGVDIEYYYVVRDAAGGRFESERAVIEYKDPSFDWQRAQEGDLAILWHDRPRRDVERVLADVAPRVEEIKSLFGLDEAGVMKAVIVNSRREARQSFPFISEAAAAGHLYGGFAFGEMGVFILHGLYPNGIIHEAAHLLLHEAVDSPLARVPSWLNEGLAVYSERQPGSEYERYLRNAIHNDQVPPLAGLRTFAGTPQETLRAYGQGHAVVRYMLAAYDPGLMAELFATIRTTHNFEQALIAVYGVSVPELDNEWRESVGLAPRDLSTPPPPPLQVLPTRRPTPTAPPAMGQESAAAPQDSTRRPAPTVAPTYTPKPPPTQSAPATPSGGGCGAAPEQSGGSPAELAALGLLVGPAGLVALAAVRRRKGRGE